MTEALSVAWRDRPFDGDYHHEMIPFRGKPPTIAAILENVPNLPPIFKEIGEVRLNGELIPREWWKRVRPRCTKDSAITLHMPIRGGANQVGRTAGSGGRTGSKNPLASVATIGVLLTAAAVSGGALAPLLAPLGIAAGSGSIAAGVAAGSISVGGSLLVASLFPPPTTRINTTQHAAQPPELGPAALSGNVLSPDAAVPRVLGTVRVFPPFLTPTLIELHETGIEYAETVMGLAGPHALSAIWVDGVDITTIPEATVEIQDGRNAGNIQSLVTRQGYTLESNLTLSQHQFDPNGGDSEKFLNPGLPADISIPQFHKFVTRNGPDELWIHFNFGSGLNDGGNNHMTVPFRIQIRPSGTTDWINLPELHYQRKATSGQSGFRTEVRIKWQTAPAAPTVTGNYNGGTGWTLAYVSVPGQALSPTTNGWTADSYFSNGGGGSGVLSALYPSTALSNVQNVDITTDNTIVYLDPAVFPPGYYDIQIQRGCSYRIKFFNHATYTDSQHTIGTTEVADFFAYYYNSGNNRNTCAIDQTVIVSECSVERLCSVWNQNPIQSSDFATISLRVYNRSLNNISVLASGYTYDWDGIGWNTQTTTSNPAPHFRDVLGGALGSTLSTLPSAIIDDPGLVTWRAACAASGYTINGVAEGKTSVDILTLIASCGYARPAASEKWGVIRDYDRTTESPVQIFTPRNLKNFNWQKAFPRMPTGFRVQFQNILLNYVTDNAFVYADPVNQDANNLESVTYDGLVAINDVNNRAAYDLQTAISRMTFYNGEADIEAIVCQRGDLVGVQYDIIDQFAGFARIRAVISSAGMVTGLQLEGTVPVASQSDVFSTSNLFNVANMFTLGGQTGIAIRLKGGNGVITEAISASTIDGLATIVTFVTPFADPGTSQLDADCLCTVGVLGTEYRRLIVYGMIPKDDFTYAMTFVDEAPELWPPKIGTIGGAMIGADDGSAVFVPDPTS